MEKICTDDSCPIHLRRDVINEEHGDLIMTTYIGELVVYTAAEIDIIDTLNLATGGHVDPRNFVIGVFEVGHGSLSDILKDIDSVRRYSNEILSRQGAKELHWDLEEMIRNGEFDKGDAP